MAECSLLWREDLAEALDAPNFVRLSSHIQELVDLSIEGPYKEALVEYQSHLENLWEFRLLKEALLKWNSPSINLAIENAQAQVEFPFISDTGAISNISLKQVSQGLELLVAPLIENGQLCFPEIPIHSTTALLQASQQVKKLVKATQEDIRNELDTSLVSLVTSAKMLHELKDICAKISSSADPVARRYLKGFSAYIHAIVESLGLKLQYVHK